MARFELAADKTSLHFTKAIFKKIFPTLVNPPKLLGFPVFFCSCRYDTQGLDVTLHFLRWWEIPPPGDGVGSGIGPQGCLLFIDYDSEH